MQICSRAILPQDKSDFIGNGALIKLMDFKSARQRVSDVLYRREGEKEQEKAPQAISNKKEIECKLESRID